MHIFVIFTQNRDMSKFVQITFSILGIVLLSACVGLFASLDQSRRPNALGELESIHFCYQNHSWQYIAAEHQSDNFYFQSIAGKFGRWGDCSQRAELLHKVRKIGFSARETMQYAFVGIDGILSDISARVNRPSRDAEYKFDARNRRNPFSFASEQIGLQVNFDQILDSIVTQLQEGCSNIEVTICPDKIEPSVYLCDIEHYANLRGSFYTSFNSDISNRKNNIEVAAQMFDGLKMPVGEEFSFNTITGRRTEKNGYMPAKIIVDKKYVEGFGGGVCQVSTTLYNALLLAGVDIREVHSHSLISSYVNMGFDAMVNFGSADLRWVNNTDSDLFLQSFVTGNQLHFRVFGAKQKSGYTLKRVTQMEKTLLPADDEIIVDTAGEYADLVKYRDECAYQTQPKNGYRVRAILETYDGEKLISRKLLRRVTYPAVRGVKVYGAAERPKVVEPAPQTPVSTPLDKNIIDFWQNFA